jgi:hypothetical protein
VRRAVLPTYSILLCVETGYSRRAIARLSSSSLMNIDDDNDSDSSNDVIFLDLETTRV